MKKLLIILSLALLLFSCDNDDMENDKPQTEPENPKIYKAVYDGDNNTEGVIPADNSLYAEGDKYSPKWDYLIKRNGNRIIAWELIGEVSSVEKPYKVFPDDKYWVDRKSVITIGGNDIGFKAVYFERLPPERFTITYHSEGHLSGEVPQDLNTYTADDDVILLPPNMYMMDFWRDGLDWSKYGNDFIDIYGYGSSDPSDPSDNMVSRYIDDLRTEHIKDGYVLGSLNTVNPLQVMPTEWTYYLKQRAINYNFKWDIDGDAVVPAFSYFDPVLVVSFGRGIIKINKNTYAMWAKDF
jgi:hypothetical protein